MIRPAPDTTIQPVRYGRGSNLMGALGTVLPDEPGALRWAATAPRATRSCSRAASGFGGGRSGR